MLPAFPPKVNIGSTKGSCLDMRVSGGWEVYGEAGLLGRGVGVHKNLREVWPCFGSPSARRKEAALT